VTRPFVVTAVIFGTGGTTFGPSKMKVVEVSGDKTVNLSP